MSQSRSRYDTTFIDTSGGILTEQLVRKLREEKCSEAAVKPTTFELDGDGPATRTEFEAEVTDAWESLKERWDSLSQNNEIFSLDTSGIREKWSIPLLETLGFDPVYQQPNLEADGIEANLSHLGWAPAGQLNAAGYDETPPILHLIQPDNEPAHTLDNGDHAGSGSSGRSPHDELQRYLNAADQQWSIVSDGLQLRLLRDYYHTYTRGYIEFDLESIFTNRNFGDFRALYRLCHASRFIDSKDTEAPLEQLYQVAVSTGVKIGEDLQSNVVEALETLGNGFLSPELREVLAEADQQVADAYFQDLLRIVYRLLFLLFAEQRGMMADRGDLYADEYSITALRDRSERHSSLRDTETDLWEGLQITFEIVGEGADAERLSVTGYNGGLFDNSELTFICDATTDSRLDGDATCPNEALLSAIHNLTHVEQDGYQQRISYADLGVDEIGAVYESLLEFTPQYTRETIELGERTVQSNQFYLDDRGMERKATGSYYTKPELVDELIDSALKPVVENRINDSQSRAENEEALLDIDVCDPACGSGAFLIAANNFLAERLAEIRSASDYPDERIVREARRSVVQHCIYGVDLNPMAVELAKVSLWINSAVDDQPLSFLDHRVKEGNSLIGTFEELVDSGVPVDAFETSQGRDWHIGNTVRKTVRTQNKRLQEDQQVQAGLDWSYDAESDYVVKAREMESVEEASIADVQRMTRLYDEFQQSETYQWEKTAFDAWAAAFYWPMDDSANAVPTPESIERLRREGPAASEKLQALANTATTIAAEESFFHWELEFPTVFQIGDSGFDCLIGNPPWERSKFEEREFFATSKPEIAKANKKSTRQELIAELQETDPKLFETYQTQRKRAEQRTSFLRNSGRYPLTAQGDINLYPLFTETGRDLIAPTGREGVVVPSGIATDYYTQEFFRELVETQSLVSLYDFENREGLFPGIDNRMKFSLLTVGGTETAVETADFAFFLTNLDQLRDDSRHFALSADDLATINPNTKTCPLFRNERHAELTLKLHESAPVMIHTESNSNPWGISFNQMLHMSNDSALLHTRDDFDDPRLDEYNRIIADETTYLPVYEGKMVGMYDHRESTIEITDNVNRSAQPVAISDEAHMNPTTLPEPLYWVEEAEVAKREPDSWPYDWVGTFKRVTSPTNHRTVVGTVIPRVAISYTLVSVHSSIRDPAAICCLYANLWSFPFDFVTRQKLNQPSLPQYVIEQTPTLPPEQFDTDLREFIVPRVLELIFTSWHEAAFADDVWDSASDATRDAIRKRAKDNTTRPEWVEGSNEAVTAFPFKPFEWNPERRRQLIAELNAAIAAAYDLTRTELSDLLDSFTTVEKNDQTEFGDFRTKRNILESFDAQEFI